MTSWALISHFQLKCLNSENALCLPPRRCHMSKLSSSHHHHVAKRMDTKSDHEPYILYIPGRGFSFYSIWQWSFLTLYLAILLNFYFLFKVSIVIIIYLFYKLVYCLCFILHMAIEHKISLLWNMKLNIPIIYSI